jgi:hypothetical protein
MSAEVPFKVKVMTVHEEWIIVHAVTSDEAKEKASKQQGVLEVKEAYWMPGDEE